MKKPKILFIDIETFPNIAETWGMYDQNVLRIRKQWELASVAYSWGNSSKVFCETRQNEKSDKRLASVIHKVLSEADVVVAHHGDAFDNKKLRARFIFHGLKPTPPYKQIDTKKLAKAQFAFTSNKLDHLGEFLGVGRKERTGGYDLWIDCMDDKASAWKRMISYNKKDVTLLKRVFKKLAPWSKLPNMASLSSKPEACPKCGTEGHLQSRGFSYTATGSYRRYQCMSCAGWSTARKAEKQKTFYK